MSDFVIDLNRWNYKAYKDYKQALQDDNFELASVYVAKVMVSWPFAIEITPEGIQELGFADMMTVYRAVGKALKNSFSEGE